jgi:hypothetical protein
MQQVDRDFAMASTNQLLLQALVRGLGEAVGRNDEAAADRYHTRIRLIAGHFDTNPTLSVALEWLLLASGDWMKTDAPNRVEAEQPVAELVDRITQLL